MTFDARRLLNIASAFFGVSVVSTLLFVDAVQAQSSCYTLERQLAALQSGGGNSSRSRQLTAATTDIRNRLNRAKQAARKARCRTGGIRLFQKRECANHSRNIARLQRELRNAENRRARQGAGTSRRNVERQKRDLILALGRGGCGAQYERIARQYDQGRETIFGRQRMNDIFNEHGEPVAGAYKTVCVRTCDGFHFPISESASRRTFKADEQICKTKFPNTEVELFYHARGSEYVLTLDGRATSSHTTGDLMERARAIDGRTYTSMPYAFKYRDSFDPSCKFERGPLRQETAQSAEGEQATLPRNDALDKQMKFGLNGPVPMRRPIVGLDPETALNLAGQFEPSAQTVSAALTGDPRLKDGKQIRRVGPSFVYGQSTAGVLSSLDPSLVQ